MRRRAGMTVDEQLAAEQLASDLRRADTLIGYLLQGKANIHQLRSAAYFIHQWMPRGMQEPPALRASAALVVRIEAAVATHGSPAAAYKALAAEEKPGATAEQLGRRAKTIERQHDRAKAAERQFAEESRRKFFAKG